MKETTVKKIISEYQKGEKVKCIAARHHLSHETIYKVLRDRHIPLRNISVEQGVLCPFYAETRYNAIRCEVSIGAIKDLYIYFKGKEKLKQHKNALCAGNYKTCAFYQSAMRAIDEAERNQLE